MEDKERLFERRFSIEQIAQFLSVHNVTVRREIERKRLGSLRIGRRILVSQSQLASYLEKIERPAADSSHRRSKAA